MRTQEQVLTQFDNWAHGNDLVRAAILTSTRANPKCRTDFLSDYDIELYVADFEPFWKDDLWLSAFGSVMVCWPFKPSFCEEHGRITRLVLFKDYVRIDFQIYRAGPIAADAYDDAYKVLIDKDGLLANLKPPSMTQYWIKKPSREEYQRVINDFWWDAHYVPKYLWREELPFATSMLGQSVRDESLHTVIEWFIGVQNDWSVNTGVRGRKFKQYLDEETWAEYESTFACAGTEKNWKAFFNAVALFRRIAKAVGEGLGYEYPSGIDSEMTAYYHWIQDRKRPDK